jgi:hypothetical protein
MAPRFFARASATLNPARAHGAIRAVPTNGEKEFVMPEAKTRKAAAKDKREGKSASTQAGEYVHEEIEHVREGKHGARSAKQAIAIGLSKARKAGVKVPAKKGAKKATKKAATKKSSARKAPAKKAATKKSTSRTRSRATTKALKREGHSAASHTALSRQAKSASKKRTASSRSAAAKKAARTRARNKS